MELSHLYNVQATHRLEGVLAGATGRSSAAATYSGSPRTTALTGSGTLHMQNSVILQRHMELIHAYQQQLFGEMMQSAALAEAEGDAAHGEKTAPSEAASGEAWVRDLCMYSLRCTCRLIPETSSHSFIAAGLTAVAPPPVGRLVVSTS